MPSLKLGKVAWVRSATGALY